MATSGSEPAAAGLTVVGDGAAANFVLIHAHSAAEVVVPGGNLVLEADFSRDGSDLVLTGSDCAQVPAFRSRTARSRLLVIGMAACLSACSTELAGLALPLFDSLTVVSWVSTAVSGKSLSEYALDALTGKDCRFIDGVLRADRRICEERGAPSTGDDFRGLAGLWNRGESEAGQAAAGLAVAQAPAETPEAAAILDAGGDDLVVATAPSP